MRRVPTLLAIITVALALSVPHGAAMHCNGKVTPIHAGDETFYIDERVGDGGSRAFAIYQETNSRPGLQSGFRPGVECTDSDRYHATCMTTEDLCIHAQPDLLIW